MKRNLTIIAAMICLLFFVPSALAQAGPVLSVSPASSDLSVGGNTAIDIDIESGGAEVYAVELKVYFDPAVLNAEAVTEGDFLKQGGTQTYSVIEIDNIQGIITFASTRFDTQTGAAGSGTLLTIIFSGEAEGSSYLNIDNAMLSDPSIQPIADITANNGTATVTSGAPYTTALTGYIRDKNTRLGIEGVNVTVTRNGNEYSALTDADGFYIIENILVDGPKKPTKLLVEAKKSGYITIAKTIGFKAGRTKKWNPRMGTE